MSDDVFNFNVEEWVADAAEEVGDSGSFDPTKYARAGKARIRVGILAVPLVLDEDGEDTTIKLDENGDNLRANFFPASENARDQATEWLQGLDCHVSKKSVLPCVRFERDMETFGKSSFDSHLINDFPMRRTPLSPSAFNQALRIGQRDETSVHRYVLSCYAASTGTDFESLEAIPDEIDEDVWGLHQFRCGEYSRSAANPKNSDEWAWCLVSETTDLAYVKSDKSTRTKYTMRTGSDGNEYPRRFPVVHRVFSNQQEAEAWNSENAVPFPSKNSFGDEPEGWDENLFGGWQEYASLVVDGYEKNPTVDFLGEMSDATGGVLTLSKAKEIVGYEDSVDEVPF